MMIHLTAERVDVDPFWAERRGVRPRSVFVRGDAPIVVQHGEPRHQACTVAPHSAGTKPLFTKVVHPGARMVIDERQTLSASIPFPDLSTPNEDVHALAELMAGRRVAVLTGAGISTESGIPDYRGAGTRRRAKHPIQYRTFLDSEAGRKRYWARAVIGWPRLTAARPNAAHLALVTMEAQGRTTGLITQNVDRLHRRAGSRDVIELHGALHDVVCLNCGAIEPREGVQARLLARNPGLDHAPARLNPDGDAELPDEAITGFELVDCQKCRGILKPHVVFFGESVPRPRVQAALSRVDRADVLLVAGSSLEVFSGFRFVKRARETNKPVALVNIGPTRADPLAQLRVTGRLGDVLPRLVPLLA